MRKNTWSIAVLALALVAGKTALSFATPIGTASTLGGDVYTVDDGIFADPIGLAFGTLLSGDDGWGYTPDPTNFGYGLLGANSVYGNTRDYTWVQDTGNGTFIESVYGGNPANGLIYDLGGQSNKVVVYSVVDHGPLPEESLEHTVYLSNDKIVWVTANLESVYQQGWDPNLSNIADGWTAIYAASDSSTFRYASVTWGGPASINTDGDNEIDAVAGLRQNNEGVNAPVPEPATLSLLGMGLLGAVSARKKKKA